MSIILYAKIKALVKVKGFKMRIISGKFKGKKLKEFDGLSVRPTSDRAREALFNILSFDVVESSFLDLFAGTGAIGIEALSRGAKTVEFIDNSPKSAQIIKFNLQSVRQNIEPKIMDAKRYLESTNLKFDFIFLDPPYNLSEEEELFLIIKNRSVLSENGVIIYEHKSDKPSKEISGFTLFDTRKYGIATFDFYKESL